MDATVFARLNGSNDCARAGRPKLATVAVEPSVLVEDEVAVRMTV
jgi:hypothetical protein